MSCKNAIAILNEKNIKGEVRFHQCKDENNVLVFLI